MIPEIVSELAPVLQALVTGGVGYMIAQQRSNSKYRDVELKFLIEARAELQQNQEASFDAMQKLFDEERTRLKEEISTLYQRTLTLQTNLSDLNAKYELERRSFQDQLSQLHDIINEHLETNTVLKTENSHLLNQIGFLENHITFLEKTISAGNYADKIFSMKNAPKIIDEESRNSKIYSSEEL